MKFKDITNESLDESPIGLSTPSALRTMVKTIVNDFLDGEPSDKELADLLRVTGKQLKKNGARSTIDDLAILPSDHPPSPPRDEEAPFR
jgi:hypothetical protein